MHKIGLSPEEIDAILRNSIENSKTISAEGIREVIAKAITENNAKLLEDIKKLFKV